LETSPGETRFETARGVLLLRQHGFQAARAGRRIVPDAYASPADTQAAVICRHRRAVSKPGEPVTRPRSGRRFVNHHRHAGLGRRLATAWAGSKRQV